VFESRKIVIYYSMFIRFFSRKLATFLKPVRPFLSIFTSRWNPKSEAHIFEILDSAIKESSSSNLFFNLFNTLQLAAYEAALKMLSNIIFLTIAELSQNFHGFNASKVIVYKWTAVYFGKSFTFFVKNQTKSSGHDTELILCVPIEFLVYAFYDHIFTNFQITLSTYDTFSAAWRSLESSCVNVYFKSLKSPSKAQLPMLFKSLSQSELLTESQRFDSQIKGVLHIKLNSFYSIGDDSTKKIIF
jgi:hypothetical protein